MDLNFTPEEEAFRAEVQTFLKEKLPKRLSDKIKAGVKLTKAEHEEWHAILQAKGWLAVIWPKEHGGPAGRRCKSSSSTTSAGWPMRRASSPSAS